MATTTYPLTTVFTPPPSCFSVWTYEAATYNYVSSGILLQNAIKELLNTECFPPSFAPDGRGDATIVYSPGVCPRGYTTLSSMIVNSVTMATCCYEYNPPLYSW